MNNSSKGKNHTNQSRNTKALFADPPCAEGYTKVCESGVCRCEPNTVDVPVTVVNFKNKKNP